MAILQSLSVVALQPLMGEGAVGLVELFTNHFSDQGQRLLESLRSASDHAWKALEIALAGNSWWERAKARLASADDRAFGQQVRTFLEGLPITELENREAFRLQCLRELREARKKNILTSGALHPAELTRQIGAFAHTNTQAVLDVQWRALGDAAGELKTAGFPSLSWLVALRPQTGTPLLVLAVRHFFRREVEKDAQLARGLIFSSVDHLSQNQQAGLDRLHNVLSQQASRMEALLGDVQAAVIATKETAQDTNARVKGLEKQIQQVLDQLQMRGRELSPRDSMSIRTEKERQLVKELLEQVRQVPEGELRAVPRLLNDVGKVQVAVGEYGGAREAFGRAIAIAPDDAARAEACYNAYRTALEQRSWDDALEQLIQAIRIDGKRYAPFPVGRYTPRRIIGAGGFGVAFLCQHKHLGIDLVVKSLLLDDLDGDADNVFREAQLLTHLDDPVFVRASDCGYADPARKSRPYLVMDYFDGVSLEEQVRKQGPLALTDLKEIALATARGLQTAHARGILHRDVKPANLLVRRDTTGWRVKLIDFGLALKRSVLENTVRGTGAWDNTLSGNSIAGTLDYAAPEQMGRLPGTAIGPHSDVYGFGKTCYFALLGTPEPDDRQKADLPLAWRRLLSDCTAQPANRLSDFEAVVHRLTRLRVYNPNPKHKRSPKTVPDSPPKDTTTESIQSPAPTAPGVFQILCPYCKRPLAVQEAHAGQTVRCTACSRQLLVPARPKTSVPPPLAPTNTPQAAAPSTSTPPLQISCPHCRQALALSRQHVGQALKCPRCSKSFALRAGS